MTRKAPKPPLNIFAVELRKAFIKAKEAAEREGRELEGELIVHDAEPEPGYWEMLHRVLRKLSDTEDPRWGFEREIAASRLAAMLRDEYSFWFVTGEPIPTSEELIKAISSWWDRTDENGPMVEERKRLGIPAGKKTATIMRDALDRLSLPMNGATDVFDALDRCAAEIEHRTGSTLRRDLREAFDAYRSACERLQGVVDRMNDAIPNARGAQPKRDTRARKMLAEDLMRVHRLIYPDEPFWVLLRAIWEELTAEETLPGEQAFASTCVLRRIGRARTPTKASKR